MRALAFAGVDISYVQRTINLAGYANAYELIFLKASEGNFPDPFFTGYEAATRAVKYRGFYHFLTHAPAEVQAQKFINTVRPFYRGAGSPDFLVIDWEKSYLGGSNVQVSSTVAYAVLEQVQAAFPEKRVWVYGYRSLFWQYGADPRLALYPRWVASYDVLEDAQSLGAVIDQYGTADNLLPFYGGQIDVNRVLDPERLHALVYGDTPLQETTDVNPVQYHEGGDGPSKTDSAENALGWTTDNAALAVRYSQSAAAQAAQILAAVQAITTPATSLTHVPTAALLAELASRVTS